MVTPYHRLQFHFKVRYLPPKLTMGVTHMKVARVFILSLSLIPHKISQSLEYNSFHIFTVIQFELRLVI